MVRYRFLSPFVAMTTEVHCIVPGDVPARACRRAVRRVFTGVERHLSRFRADSELNRLCAAGGGLASPPLFRALTTAARAWRRTDGLFDPRVRADLEALGYTADLVFGGDPPDVRLPRAPVRGSRRAPLGRRPWLVVRWTRDDGSTARPRCRRVHPLLLPEGPRLDLGGIGKGLAVRYAARTLRARLRPPGPRRPRTLGLCGTAGAAAHTRGFLVDAGGDIWAEGLGPDGRGWQIGVLGPRGGWDPVCLLRVAQRAVCTSGRGRRAWLLDGRPVHHLIDPQTGRPAGTQLWSVTVIGRDPAWAEVWSKALFVAGTERGRALAVRRGLAAIFVRADGRITASPAGRRYLEDIPAPKGDGSRC